MEKFPNQKCPKVNGNLILRLTTNDSSPLLLATPPKQEIIGDETQELTADQLVMPVKTEQPEQHLVLETTNFEYNNKFETNESESKFNGEESILEENNLELIKRCESNANIEAEDLDEKELPSKTTLFDDKEQLNELSLKYNYFKHQILNYGSRILVLKIELNRETLCDDSFCFLSNLKPEYARSQFLIKFKDEEGVDYGGVGKEWFHLLSSEIFKPSYGLFVVNSESNQLEINKHSIHILPVILSFFL